MVKNSFLKIVSIFMVCICAACSTAIVEDTNQVVVTPAPAVTNTGVSDKNVTGTNVTDTKLLTIEDMNYVGAFALSRDAFGKSSANWSNGVMHVADGRFYITGHNHHDNIAEFILPPLTAGNSLSELKIADQTRQNFAAIYNSSRLINREGHDYISGLYEHNGALVVNSFEYYDAPADNRQTTLVVTDSANLQSSKIMGLHSLEGAARAAGWISEIPQSWQPFLGGTHISGNSSGFPIIGRLSVGPSAFVFDIDSLTTKSRPGQVKTQEVLGFSLKRPLHEDLHNTSGQNSIWTHISEVRYGFIVPGTATYMTIGITGGHKTGVGYKVIQEDGFLCPGYCPNSKTDYQNYYWLWDVNDMVRVRNGQLSPNDVKPYRHGPLNLPSWVTAGDSSKTYNHRARIGGASYDQNQNILYVSVLNALRANNGDVNPPLVLGYQLGQ